MPPRLFTDKQVEFIHHGTDAVDPSNAYNFEEKITTNANTGLPQLFELLPHLREYLEIETIRQEVDPVDVGIGLGQMLSSEQRRTVAAMLLWGEKQPDEATADFLTRVPNLIEEYHQDLSQVLQRLSTSGEFVQFLQAVSDRLETQFNDAIEAYRDEHDLTLAIPTQNVIAWTREEQPSNIEPPLGELLDVLYGPWEDGITEKFRQCWYLLIGYGMQFDVSSVRDADDTPGGDQWRPYFPPTAEDRKQYLAVVNALEETIQDVVVAYGQTHRIPMVDRVLCRACEELERLDRPARDLLRGSGVHDIRGTWQGQNTQRANNWTHNRAVPLLSLDSDVSNRRSWRWTAYGRVVRQLWELDIDKDHLAENGVPDALDADRLAAAIDEFDTTKS